MIYVPAAVDGLTISASMSMLDSEITDTLTPSGDVVKGDSLAFAPELQANIQARWEWETSNGMTALHASYGTFRRILLGHYQNKPRS